MNDVHLILNLLNNQKWVFEQQQKIKAEFSFSCKYLDDEQTQLRRAQSAATLTPPNRQRTK